MPRFKDRKEAGEALAEQLLEYKGKNAIVIALPRGGVPVAWPVARRLNLPLDIVVPRKIGAPGHEEYAIGAITQDKQAFLDDEAIAHLHVSSDYVQKEIEKQAAEATRRLKAYRGNRPLLDFTGKTVILVDDGIATGYTMKAAISSARAHKCAELGMRRVVFYFVFFVFLFLFLIFYFLLLVL
eukprot:Phypoly_transcript_13938.p1 GENE.Phypoly_transcript_13938~~Phypoly_transcript_13938.p1  ORF type:complete len:183 (+),score=26.39 Phypoly_transcript_13938:109-657(+)